MPYITEYFFDIVKYLHILKHSISGLYVSTNYKIIVVCYF